MVSSSVDRITRSLYFMNHLLEKAKSVTIQLSMKSAIAAFMLVLLVPGQPVMAQTASFVALDQSVTIAPFDIEAEPVITPAPAPQPTVQDVLLAVCESNGYGQDCAQTLLGMIWNESQNISTAVGDHGKARGYFQIWTKLHNIPVSCAEDLVCSSNWTLHYMERHSYPKYVSYAVQCHNGCNVPNGYAARALRNGKNLWAKPMEVHQAAPIVLPVKLAVK